jgi:chromosome segregation ATPase
MTLDQLIDNVETRVYALGKRIWPDDPRAELRAEIERVSIELQEHVEQATRYRSAIEEARARIADHEFRAAQLASRVETYVHTGDQVRAWRHALELDRVRRHMADIRAGLPGADKALGQHRAHIDRLERCLQELQAQLQTRQQRAPAPSSR